MAKFIAPAHLPEHVQRKLHAKYAEAKKIAAVNYPDDEASQHTAALKEAHRLLAVPAPESAADIDKLEEHQILHRGTRVVKGKDHRVVVTSDGKKYTFPVLEGTKPKEKKKGTDNNNANPDASGENSGDGQPKEGVQNAA